ncbi:hypothetical protein D3C79_977520 [compost metagenome]
MQAVALYTIVGLRDAGIGIVNGAHANFMPTCKAQTETNPIFELERRTQFVAFNLGTGKRRDANPCFDVGLY